MSMDEASSPAPQVPLLVAVTGHRDLRDEDLVADSALRETVRTCLAGLETAHSHTPIVLLSGMAEGADRLVAEAALEMGIDVIAYLPMPIRAYEASFRSTASRAAFRDLLGRCTRVLTVPPEEGPGATSESAPYEALGRCLVRDATVLLALWDGQETESLGGTKHVIDMMLSLAPRQGHVDLSDAADAAHVLHIPVARRGATQPVSGGVRSLLAPGCQTGTLYRRVIFHIDELNREMKRVHARDPEGVAESRSWLAGDVPAQVWRPVEGLLDGHAHVDRLAIGARRRATRALRVVTAMAGTTGLLFLLYTDLSEWPLFLLLYLSALATTVLFLLARIRRTDVKNRHLDFRALSEGLRIAVFWRLAGVRSRVADVYLRTPAGELNWIRRALRAWCLVAAADAPDPDVATRDERLDAVQARWIDDQADWYRKASAQRARLRDRVDKLERVFMASVVACSVALAVLTIFALPASMITDHDLAPLFEEIYLGPSDWLQLAAGVMLLGVAICMAYAEARAYREEAQAFDRMAALFQRAAILAAQIRHASYEGDRAADLEQLVFTLGREALRENAEWLLLHRERPLTAQLG